MSRNTTQIVSAGRIVHFLSTAMVQDNVPSWPAIVTKVYDNDTVDLHVFPDAHSGDPFNSYKVDYFDGFDAKSEFPRAWFWPPRA